jgi:hypothetical protein
MKGWMSQLLIGIIVTVVGTLVADAIMRGVGEGRHAFGTGHVSSWARESR